MQINRNVAKRSTRGHQRGDVAEREGVGELCTGQGLDVEVQRKAA